MWLTSACFQNAISRRQSASLLSPHDTQTSMPTSDGIAAGLFGQAAKLAENFQRGLIGRVGVGHPAVAPSGNARQRVLMVPTVPKGNFSRRRARVDPGVVDGVILALEGDIRFGPKRLHDLDLFLGPAAPVMEVFVQPGKFDRVPADPDAKAEPTPGQHIEAGRLFCHQCGLPLRNDQHAGGKRQFRRRGGKKAKQHERVMIHAVGDARPRVIAGLGARSAPQNVVRRFQEIIA